MFKLNNKAIQILIDMIINLAGTGISLVVLQLFIYPIVARQIDAASYGQMQSIVSVIYLVGGTFGGALCTTRLLHEYEYQQRKILADYNILFIINFILILVFMPVILFCYLGEIKLSSLFLITLVAILNYASNYFHVGLRLLINYKCIFIERLLGCVGYIVGFVIFYETLAWEYIFIFSYLFQIIYDLYKFNLLKEPWKCSGLFRKTFKSHLSLSGASLLSKALTYFDKLMLYPLLGGEAVSVYFAANIFGKLILQTIEPITNVILSYLSKKKNVTAALWRMIIPISVTVCVGMYILCMLISKPILYLLYPQWAEQAVKIIPLTTLALAISAFINLLYPFTLKATEAYKQLIINGAGLVGYIIAIVLLYQKYNLEGCCIALIISYLVKLIFIVMFCFRRKRKNDNL